MRATRWAGDGRIGVESRVRDLRCRSRERRGLRVRRAALGSVQQGPDDRRGVARVRCRRSAVAGRERRSDCRRRGRAYARSRRPRERARGASCAAGRATTVEGHGVSVDLSARGSTDVYWRGPADAQRHAGRESAVISRRDAIAALASTATLSLISGCTRERAPVRSATMEADALALLDQIADNLLRLAPEGATSLGIDTGARAALRSQLSDRSAQGQQQIANQVRQDLERARDFDVSGLDHATRTSVEVVRSAYATAAEGFALPYGDITVG